MNVIRVLYLVLALNLTAATEYHLCTDEERAMHPHLCTLMYYAVMDPINLANELYLWSKNRGLILDIVVPSNNDVLSPSTFATASKRQLLRFQEDANADEETLPTVIAHGMGDSCFNSGMKKFTSHISTLTSSFAKCIPTGSTQHTDTTNGFFLNMDASVDVFADQIKSIPQFQNGFNAVGLSQGSNIIRGYIAKVRFVV